MASACHAGYAGSNCFQTLRQKKKSQAPHLTVARPLTLNIPGKCISIAERRFVSFDEQMLDCDI